MISESRFQIGKNGLTQGVIDSLNLSLKTHDQIRITVLKSLERNREKMILMATDILSRVNYHCRYKIIGFTIILKRTSAKLKKQSAKTNREKSL